MTYRMGLKQYKLLTHVQRLGMRRNAFPCSILIPFWHGLVAFLSFLKVHCIGLVFEVPFRSESLTLELLERNAVMNVDIAYK
jgi:hypothetical protein